MEPELPGGEEPTGSGQTRGEGLLTIPGKRSLTRLVVAVIAVCVWAIDASALDLWRVRIDSENAQSVADRLEGARFDVLRGSVGDISLELVVTADEWVRLESMGYLPIALEKGRPFEDIQAERANQAALPAGYPTLAQIIDKLAACQSAFPNICRVVDLTEKYNVSPTFEGRHVFAVKISNNVAVDEDEPAFLLVSNHHAREIVTPLIALHAIEQLTTKYGNDPRITDLVDAYEIWIAPVWNPDGYNEVFTGNNLWRKNKRVFPDGVGVDLNRNYPFGWSSGCAGSRSPTSETYKGPRPVSEAETQLMTAWSDDRHFAKIVDYHSTGREVLSGYLCHSHTFEAFMQLEAVALSNASGYGGARRSPSAEGEHEEWQWAKHGAHAFLIETHTQFQPSYESALAEAALVFPGALWLLERPIPLTGHVTDTVTGEPVDALITYQGVRFRNEETNRSSGPFGRYHAFLPPGSYTVKFSAEGYVAQSHPVVITENEESVLEVGLSRVNCLHGQGCVAAVPATSHTIWQRR